VTARASRGRVDALVLDLDSRAGLCIARTLGRRGLRIAVAAREREASGLRTRYAIAGVLLPAPEQSFDAYADSIVSFARDVGADAILPSTDQSLEALHARRDALRGVARPAIAESGPFALASNKARTLDLAREIGIRVPRTCVVRTGTDLTSAIGEIGLPAVVKPASSWVAADGGGTRMGPVYVESLNEAVAATAPVLAAGADAVLQEVVPGRRETVKLFRVDGRFVARLAMAVDRCWPPLGGSSCMRHTIAPPADALAQAELLVASSGLDGYAEVEFRRDVRGRPVLMEINPRLSQSLEVALRAGVDFAHMQFSWACGDPVSPVPGYRVGRRVGWLGGDGRLLAAATLGGPPPRPRLRDVLPAVASDYLVRRARVEGFELGDLRPCVSALAFAVRATARSLRRGRR
jgi:ATP-grasp in the biosynthetic pathway with Ter operon